MNNEVHFSEIGGDKLMDQLSVFSGSSGILSILSHYKSNSRIISFPSWFSNIAKKYDGHLLSQDVRYRGNASDLWGLLSFEIKAIGAIFAQNNYETSLAKKYIQMGQIYMIYKSQQIISKCAIKDKIQEIFYEKTKKLKQQILSVKQAKIRKSQILYQKQQNDFLFKQKAYSIQDVDIQFYLTCFNKENKDKINYKLKQFLKRLIKMLNKSVQQLANDRIKLIIILICYQLLIVLKNMNWHTLCLSDLNVTFYLIRYLPQVNGVLKISKFLHDASRTTLEQQLHNQHRNLFKTNIQ